MLKVIMNWTVIAVPAGLNWLDKVHQLTTRKPAQTIGDNFALQNVQLTHDKAPTKLAIISPFKILKVEMEWTVIAFWPGLVGWTKCTRLKRNGQSSLIWPGCIG
jgi:hypothetical protein